MTETRLSYPIATHTWATPGGRPATFAFREGTNDWNTINSCLAADEYHLAGRVLFGTVLDIGGYVGSVGVTIAIDNPEARVVIVEPVPENQDLILTNAMLNDVADRVTVFRGAIGPAGVGTSEIRFRYVGDLNLEHHAFVGNSSLSYLAGGPVPHETMEVETLGLGALLDRFGIDEPELVKIDCEGAEWPFFETATVADLRRLPEIIGEAHAVMGHTSRDLLGVLGKTHKVMLLGPEGGTMEFSAVRL